MIEHVNDIFQRIRFLLSMNLNKRPSSAIRQSAKNSRGNLKKANIHFEEFQKQDSNVKYTNDIEIPSKLQECTLLMKIVYFSNNSSNSEAVNKSYSLQEYQIQKQVNEEDFEYKSDIKLSKGVIGYQIFKDFLMHIYHMIINRIVRTAHLADISNNKKGNKGKFIWIKLKIRCQKSSSRIYKPIDYQNIA